MFNHLLNIFKSNKNKKNNYYDENLSRAIKYHEEGLLHEALDIYKELYTKLKQDNYQEKLALVLNNMIIIKKESNQEAKELFNKLLELRFSLLIRDEEYYSIDYIYTLLMGVEWFDLPKDKLIQAESMLKIYSNFKIYKPTLEKIKELNSSMQT